MQQVADHLGCSAGKISRLEAALVPPNLADIRVLAEFYGLAADEREELIEVARQARQRSWWSTYLDVVPADSATFFGLEDGAASISEYSAGIIPGLLQAPAYIHAVMADAADAATALTDRRVELRLRRQQILRRTHPPNLHVVLDEAALHRTIGGRRAQLAQLAHLREMADLPHVTVQVLPLEAGGHPQLESRFSILRFADPADPQVVYLEEPHRNTFLDAADELDRYSDAFRRICELAHPLNTSVALVDEIARSSRRRHET